MRALFSRRAVTVGALFVVSVAFGHASAANDVDLTGRWSAQRPKLTLDIVRCGTGWCGVEVTEDASCARVALRLDSYRDALDPPGFAGQLHVMPGAEPYAVKVTLHGEGAMAILRIFGHTGGAFQPWRRTYPVDARFVRLGEPVCREPKVS